MTLGDYQELAARTINQGLRRDEALHHSLHGMSAEVGELHELYQKVFQGHMIETEKAKKEVGDILWFIAEYCTINGWRLDDICKMNIEKLKGRYPDGFSVERSLNRASWDD